MKFLRNQKGFSLVELMIVVAIIGILSAVAIPNFKKYQAKSKTSEAKLQLAGAFTAEQSFFADEDAYHTCLAQMGYEAYRVPTPSASASAYPEGSKSYYTIGFSKPVEDYNGVTVNNVCATAGGNGLGYGISYWPGIKGAGGDMTGRDPSELPSVATPTTFVIHALGNVANEVGKIDSWQMDQDKSLSHTAIGY
jgi:type IV pilus assembly protein PilA